MESYCLKCKKNTENIDTEMILSKCVICCSEKSVLIKNQEAKEL